MCDTETFSLKLDSSYKAAGGYVRTIVELIPEEDSRYSEGLRYLDEAGVAYYPDGRYELAEQNGICDLVEEVVY